MPGSISGGSGSGGGPSVTYNVKAYGAKADGATDDSSSIQACINACPAGGTVSFPDGIYIIGTPLALLGARSYVGTFGLVSGSTLKMKAGANLSAIAAQTEYLNNVTTPGQPVRVVNICFDGNSANNASGNGLVLMGPNSLVRECSFLNIPQNGLVVSDHTLNASAITGTAIENRIESCKISVAGNYGIWISDSTSKVLNGYIQNCLLSSCQSNAIQLDAAQGWMVTNNNISNCGQSGIFANNATETLISGNTIDTFGQSSVNTTSTTSVSLGTTSPITPASMTGNGGFASTIAVGSQLTIDTAGNQETITVASVTGSTFTPATAYTKAHSGTYTIVSNVGTNAIYNGIGGVLQGPKATVVTGNMIEMSAEFNPNIHYNYLSFNSNCTTADTRILAEGNHIQAAYLSTQFISNAIGATGVQTATVSNSMVGIVPGVTLQVDTSTSLEYVTVISVTSTTFTANFTKTHASFCQLKPAASGTNFSQGLVMSISSAQTAKSLAFNLIMVGNRVDMIGVESVIDATIKTTNRVLGDEQITGHLFGAGAAPTVAINANAGTGATASLTSANDMRGVISFTTGTSPVAGTMATLTYAATYGGTISFALLTPRNAVTAAQQLSATGTATGFSIASQNPAASTAYSVAYHVIG